jgi:hypothetical protein
MTLKPLTVSLSDNDMTRWRKLGPYVGDAFKFWKEMFDKHPMLKPIKMEGDESRILHLRYVGGSDFRIEYSDRKLSEKAVKAVKIMEKYH